MQGDEGLRVSILSRPGGSEGARDTRTVRFLPSHLIAEFSSLNHRQNVHAQNPSNASANASGDMQREKVGKPKTGTGRAASEDPALLALVEFGQLFDRMDQRYAVRVDLSGIIGAFL